MAAKKPAVKVVEPKNINEALFKIQGEMPTIPRNGTGTTQEGRTYKYPYLDDIINIAMPIMQKYGVMLTQPITDGKAFTRLVHVKSGTEYVSDIAIGTPGSVQQLGARLTYLRRYMLGPILGISIEPDLDGNKGGPENEKPPVAPVPMPSQPPEAPVVPPAPVLSDHFKTVNAAIISCGDVNMLEVFVDRVKASEKLNPQEKEDLLEVIKKRETELDGTVHTS